MLNVGLRVLIASSLLAGIVACGKPKNKKPSLGQSRREQSAEPDWAKDAVGNASGCLKLDVLANLMRNFGTDLVSIHTTDLDFVTVQTFDGTPPSEAQRKAGKVTTSRRYQFSRIDGVSDILKANYFLRPEKYVPIAETYPGSRIDESKQIGALINVVSQNACTSVTFKGQGPREIVESGARMLKVSVGNEYWVYQFQGRDQLMISVIRPAGEIPQCEGARLLNERSLVRRSYIVSKSRSRDRYVVSKPLAITYFGFVYAMPELLGRPTRNSQRPNEAKPDDRRRNQRNPPQERVDYVALSGTSLNYLARLLDEQKGLTALTCTATPTPKP